VCRALAVDHVSGSGRRVARDEDLEADLAGLPGPQADLDGQPHLVQGDRPCPDDVPEPHDVVRLLARGRHGGARQLQARGPGQHGPAADPVVPQEELLAGVDRGEALPLKGGGVGVQERMETRGFRRPVLAGRGGVGQPVALSLEGVGRHGHTAR